MPEQYQEQINKKQEEIETLAGPLEAKRKIGEYRSTYQHAVDNGQREIMAAAGTLKSPEARAYLTSTSAEIAGSLASMAEKGRQIIKAHMEEKEGVKTGGTPSLASLSAALKRQLSQIKKTVESFSVLEEIETKDLKGAEEANDKLNNSPGSADPSEIFKKKDELVKKLQGLGSKFMSTTASRSYAKIVTDQYKKVTEKVNSEKSELATGPIARHTIMQNFLKGVDSYAQLIEAAKANPSVHAIERVRAQAAAIDPEKAHADVFGSRDKGTFAYVESMYKHLEGEHAKAKTKYESLKEGFDEIEKEALTKAAEKMLADFDWIEKEEITPLWEKYEPLSRRTALKGNELESLETTEKGLMAAYLTLKLTISPFERQETQFKLQGNVYQRVQTRIKKIKDQIRQIEVNRETRKSQKSLSEVGDVAQYVTFLGKEKDGKIYEFNAAYDALSEDKKQEVRMAVESIIARDKAVVRTETQQAMLDLTKSTGNFDKISEILGDKAKKYAEGLKLLAEGKHKESVKAFEAYVGQSFTSQEQELNAAAISDAKEKISLIKYSGDFYEGLSKYKEGDINAAAKLFRTYVEWAEGTGAEIHKEQISHARDVLRLIGMDKVKQLDDLLQDVKLWKKKMLQDQYGKGGEKVDFKIEGPEVEIIVQGIQNLRTKVEKGELIDFDQEFSKLKASAHAYLQKYALKPEDNVIDKLSELYEGINSMDPKVRKETYTKFAKELREYRAYDKAREYLDKALTDGYRETIQSGKVSQEKVMQEMLGNAMIMGNVKKAAAAYLAQFKKENPDVPEEQLRQQAEQIVFNMWMRKRYTRELRRHMTLIGRGEEALMLYNEWSPYEEDKDTVWYKPWNYEYYSAEEWDEFKDAAKENVAMTLATLPIGFGAGAVGANISKVAFRGLASRLLVRTGAAGAEAAITVIEQGGVQAIKFGSQAWKALTPQMQRAVILSRLGAGALSVTVEGTLLLGGSKITEGVITGRTSPITSGNLVESILKALAFRGIGLGGNKLFENALRAGGKRATAALVAMESLSGIAGTGVEAASLYATGHGEYVDTSMILRSLIENALTSTGMHLAHRVAAPKAKAAPAKGEAVIEAAPKTKPSAELPTAPEGPKAKPTKEVSTVPEGLRARALKEAPTVPEGAKTKPEAETPTVPEGRKPKRKHTEPPISGEEPTVMMSEKAPPSGEEPTIHAEKAPVSEKVSSERPSVVVRDTSPEGIPAYIGRAAKNEQILQESLANKPERKKFIDDVRKAREIRPQDIARLTKQEILLLAGSDPSHLNETVVSKILKSEYDVIEDVIDRRTGEKKRVRIYTDDGAEVGAGGLGRVHDCYFVVEGENGLPSEARLRKGVVKKAHAAISRRIPKVLLREVETLRAVRDQKERAGLLDPLYVGQSHEGDVLLITEKIEPLRGENGTSLSSQKIEGGREMWERMPPENTLGFMAQAIGGMRKLHAMGRMHLDVKPGNIFVGLVDGKPTAVMGDLATVPVSELGQLHVRREKIPQLDSKRHTVLVDSAGDSIPYSPHYMDGAHRHARCAVEWAKIHPNKNIPPHIASLIDMGQTATMLHDMAHHLRTKEGKESLPMESRDVVPDALDALVAKMDDLPDMDKLDANIKTAEESKDANAIEKAKAAKKEALDGMGDRITMAEVEVELQVLAAFIGKRRETVGPEAPKSTPSAPSLPPVSGYEPTQPFG